MKRVTAPFTDQQIQKLGKLANQKGVTATAMFQPALETEFYIREEIAKAKKILVKDIRWFPKKNIPASPIWVAGRSPAMGFS